MLDHELGAAHSRGDRAVSADQFKRLMPSTRLIEQGSDDRGDVGAGDGASGDRRGREADPAGGGSVGEAAGAAGPRDAEPSPPATDVQQAQQNNVPTIDIAHQPDQNNHSHSQFQYM